MDPEEWVYSIILSVKQITCRWAQRCFQLERKISITYLRKIQLHKPFTNNIQPLCRLLSLKAETWVSHGVKVIIERFIIPPHRLWGWWGPVMIGRVCRFRDWRRWMKVCAMILCVCPKITKSSDDTNTVGTGEGVKCMASLNVSLPKYFQKFVHSGG